MYFSNFLYLGLEWDNISECVDWMVPCQCRWASTSPAKLKIFKQDFYGRQTQHTDTYKLSGYVGMFLVFFGLFDKALKPDSKDTNGVIFHNIR